MITPDILTDTVLEWVQTLDYEYMILHILVSYGLYYSNNMKWISDKLGGLPYSIWWVGGILAIIEICRFSPHFGGDALTVQKIVSIAHSFLLIQVFVEDIVRNINRWINIFKNKKTD